MKNVTKLVAALGFCALGSVAALHAARAQQRPTGRARDFQVRPALHSIGYAGLWRGQAFLSVDDFLVKAKQLGYDAVALMAKRPHVSPFDYDDNARKALRQKMERLGLKLAFLAGYTDFTVGMERQGIPYVEMQAVYVRELAKLAHDLGTDMVRIFTGYEQTGIPYETQYGAVLEGLKMAGREAARYGVTLAVQNHHDIALHHDAMYWLLKEVNMPNVMAGWDAWSPTMEGQTQEQIRAGVRKMQPFIVNTIAADYVKLPRFKYEPGLTNYAPQETVMRAVPMGKGVVDYKTFFGALKEIGYHGYITYEMCSILDGGGSIENLDRTARAFLEYMKPYGASRAAVSANP